MSTITTIITPTREIFDRALKAGREAGQATRLGTGMNAPLLASLQGKVDTAWSEIQKMLYQASIYGRAKVQETLEATIAKLNALLASAGDQVREFHDLVMEKIRSFVRSFFEQTLALLPTSISTSASSGGVTMVMSGMTFTQKLKIGGSIEASLTAAASLLSEGEIEVASEYKIPAPTGTVAPV